MDSHEEARQTPVLVALVGPPAVGKMTVGQEMSRLTGWPLYFNHRLLDLLTDFFPWGSRGFNHAVRSFNDVFYEEAGASGLRLINTWGWRFDVQAESEAVVRYASPILAAGGEVFVAELTALLDVRLERNRTENRQRHKKTDWATDEWLTEIHHANRWSSGGTLPVDLPHHVIDTTVRTAMDSAREIYRHFKLERFLVSIAFVPTA